MQVSENKPCMLGAAAKVKVVWSNRQACDHRWSPRAVFVEANTNGGKVYRSFIQLPDQSWDFYLPMPSVEFTGEVCPPCAQ